MNGEPVENATIAVDGDMPEHGHGLPTCPQVTKYLGNGDYLVEGEGTQIIAFLKTLDSPINADPQWMTSLESQQQKAEALCSRLFIQKFSI
jgi:hypothetical protein